MLIIDGKKYSLINCETIKLDQDLFVYSSGNEKIIVLNESGCDIWNVLDMCINSTERVDYNMLKNMVFDLYELSKEDEVYLISDLSDMIHNLVDEGFLIESN